jgi:hypothetical protein
MATMVDPNSDALGDDDGMYHDPIMPVETPANTVANNKKLHTVLRKLGNFLRARHPESIRMMEKMSIFDDTADDPGMEC